MCRPSMNICTTMSIIKANRHRTIQILALFVKCKAIFGQVFQAWQMFQFSVERLRRLFHAALRHSVFYFSPNSRLGAPPLLPSKNLQSSLEAGRVQQSYLWDFVINIPYIQALTDPRGVNLCNVYFVRGQDGLLPPHFF